MTISAKHPLFVLSLRVWHAEQDHQYIRKVTQLHLCSIYVVPCFDKASARQSKIRLYLPVK